MSNYRYALEKYKSPSSRLRCPACGRKKVFTSYVDTYKNNERLPEQYGMCDRSDKCQYHLNPYKDGYKGEEIKDWRKPELRLEPKPSFHAYDVFKSSLNGYDKNKFCVFIEKKFGEKILAEVIDRYQIGTANKWTGSVVFWQIDQFHMIHAGKVIDYDSETGRRIKDHTNWAHRLLKLEDFVLKQCFFGEHLLNGNNKPVAIVESEKTAIICSILIPDYVWLAAGSKNGLGIEKCRILNGRNVILFPDAGSGYADWKDRGFTVSDVIEKRATREEKAEGLDLADYLLNSSYTG